MWNIMQTEWRKLRRCQILLVGIVALALCPVAQYGTQLIVDPEIFVIGGGVSRAGQFLVDRVFKYYDYFTPISKFKAKIGLATLGNDAGIYGAARLIL